MPDEADKQNDIRFLAIRQNHSLHKVYNVGGVAVAMFCISWWQMESGGDIIRTKNGI